MMSSRIEVTALLLAATLLHGNAIAASDEPTLTRVAQASVQATAEAQRASNPIGSVSAMQGGASVSRSGGSIGLKVKDPIFKADVLQTAANGTLSITFDDATTFLLTPNSRIEVNEFIYRVRGARNQAEFDILHGSVAFLASAVARTGDMKIETPVAAIGIRGTSGVIDVAAASGPVNIKLYADTDAHVGRIEVFGRGGGTPLAVLTGAATGLAVGQAGAQAAVTITPIQVSAADIARDRSILRQANAAQQLGRRINLERRIRPNAPQRRLDLAPTPSIPLPTIGTLPPAPDLPAPTPPGLSVPQPSQGPTLPAPALPSPSLPTPSLPGPRLPGR